jgi:2-succinyl-6-hydroxy-2,4-cyclohexadiene-1-carboxylate synthase
MGTGAQEPLHDRLASFTFPVLLLAGAEDEKFSQIAREMAAAIPDSRAGIVASAGHAAQLEQPETCAELVRAFVKQYRGQGVAL